MSQNRRRSVQGYHYDGTDRLRYPDGRPSCRWCRAPVSRPRRSYCSDVCIHEWRLRTDPGYLRRQVFARDHGICAECGIDSEARFREISRDIRAQLLRADIRPGTHYAADIERAALRALGVRPYRASFWDAHHLIPVAEGGGETDLPNLQTLCLPCHDRATAALAARLAAARHLTPASPELPGLNPST